MADFYFDSSGLVKNYTREVGSTRVAGLIHPRSGHQLSISRVAAVEVVSALVRRAGGGAITNVGLTVSLAQFRLDFRTLFDVVELSVTLIDQSMILAEKHALRGYDAIQLASALSARTDSIARGSTLTLISADRELNAAAPAEGLNVEDPNNHP